MIWATCTSLRPSRCRFYQLCLIRVLLPPAFGWKLLFTTGSYKPLDLEGSRPSGFLNNFIVGVRQCESCFCPSHSEIPSGILKKELKVTLRNPDNMGDISHWTCPLVLEEISFRMTVTYNVRWARPPQSLSCYLSVCQRQAWWHWSFCG